MSGPVRVQLRRTKGWRMPPNTVKVSRPSPFGNIFTLEEAAEFRDMGLSDGTPNEIAVEWYRAWLRGEPVDRNEERVRRLVVLDRVPLLRGKNLACWCALCPEHRNGRPFGVQCDACAPCHADVLGELANG